MFIIQVVPLLIGTEMTTSRLRHTTCCWMSWLIHGGRPPGWCGAFIIRPSGAYTPGPVCVVTIPPSGC